MSLIIQRKKNALSHKKVSIEQQREVLCQSKKKKKGSVKGKEGALAEDCVYHSKEWCHNTICCNKVCSVWILWKFKSSQPKRKARRQVTQVPGVTRREFASTRVKVPHWWTSVVWGETDNRLLRASVGLKGK